ncbi:MAG: urease accessory protein UreF [Rhodoferax sp.]
MGRAVVTVTKLPDSSLMQLMWLASPALPVGGFSYSECLEAAVDAALVATEKDASEWLVEQLFTSLARSDLAVLAQAIAAWRAPDAARIAQLNAWVLATRESGELRAQTEQMGRSLLEWLRNHTTALPEQIRLLADLQPSYPLAFALAASATGAPLRACLLSYAFGWAENMVQATIKAVPLGQSAGQRILSELTAAIPAAVNMALSLDDDSRQAFSPMLAILSARHETQYSRLFRS